MCRELGSVMLGCGVNMARPVVTTLWALSPRVLATGCCHGDWSANGLPVSTMAHVPPAISVALGCGPRAASFDSVSLGSRVPRPSFRCPNALVC
jgi:hypothetical protein